MPYNVPIPEPKFLSQKVARIDYDDDGVIEVFWERKTSQALFHLTNIRSLSDPEEEDGSSSWFIQDDGNIIDSLCYFLPYHFYQILLSNIFVFEDQTLSKGKCATVELESDIYDCDWSDFACDRLVLHMSAKGHKEINSEMERDSFVEWQDTTNNRNDVLEVPISQWRDVAYDAQNIHKDVFCACCGEEVNVPLAR